MEGTEGIETMEVEDGGDNSFGDFMSGLEQQVLEMVKESAKAPKTAWEHWGAFSSAVNWNETWIRCLLAFHVFIILTVIVTRKNVDAQTFLFFALGITVYLSERINTYASDHWADFATQNYFDKSGIFTGLMLSGPIILVLLFQLVNFLFLTSSALISVKRNELKRKFKANKAAEGTAATSTASSTVETAAEPTSTTAEKKKDK